VGRNVVHGSDSDANGIRETGEALPVLQAAGWLHRGQLTLPPLQLFLFAAAARAPSCSRRG
jgi:hypothetical protein